MALSNTAVPKYYGMFRDAVIRGEIPVCKEISMEMNRIDDLIANPGVYYDDQAVEGWIAYCESELTLTDGSDLSLLDSFKLWGEQIFGWYYQFCLKKIWMFFASIVFICFCLIGTTNLCFYYIYIVYFCKVLFDIFLFFVNLA